MAKIRVVTENDTGKGLEIANQKLNVVVDDVTIKIVDNKLVAQIPETGVDLRVTKIKADQDTGKLKITVDDGAGGNETTVQTSLAELLVVSAEAGNIAEVKDDGIFVGKAKVVEAVKDPETVKALAELLKGDELQGLDGTTIGYVLPKAEAAAEA
jgi:hypothetical protein|nr:MAG TPA: hypothetical protein [Caudoviricetes sp.]